MLDLWRLYSRLSLDAEWGYAGSGDATWRYFQRGDCINARGQVIGVGSANVHPFLWTQSQGMQDLNNLIPADSSFTLQSANAINARGQIVGNGSISSRAHAFLLTPLDH